MKIKKPQEKPKIIHLPQTTIDGLTALAKIDRTKCKPFMEKILIDYEKHKSK